MHVAGRLLASRAQPLVLCASLRAQPLVCKQCASHGAQLLLAASRAQFGWPVAPHHPHHLVPGRRWMSTRATPSLMESSEDGLGHLKRRVEACQTRLQSVLEVADLPAATSKLAMMEQEAGQAHLWEDPAEAQALLAQIAHLKSEVESIRRHSSQLEEAAFAIELLESSPEMDTQEAGEVMREALATLATLDSALDSWELQRLLSGPFDARDARLLITAGAGGADAMDWAEMLERMYTRWADARGFGVKVVERSPGEEAGVKSVELVVTGQYAYGYLRSEKGTHRLVRNSPFNAKGLRQTSFAGVEVLPILNETQELLEVKESDLQFQFMRSGGAGGQNVNKVESGVRIIHVPTGITVKCTQERTQLANRAIAMDMLRAQLLVVMQEQQAAQVAEIRGDQVIAAWGQQIRNYVLHPYKMVKCTRTGHETTDAAAVLDGDLDPFISAFLKQKVRRETDAALAV